MEFRVSFNDAEVKKWLHEAPQVFNRELKEAINSTARTGLRVIAESLNKSPGGGALRKYKLESLSPFSKRLVPQVNYADYVEDGYQIHFIAPKSKKALAWGSGNAMYFSRGHWVGPYAGSHKLAEVVMPKLIERKAELVGEAINRAFKIMNGIQEMKKNTWKERAAARGANESRLGISPL
jgi:hypothetical protein